MAEIESGARIEPSQVPSPLDLRIRNVDLYTLAIEEDPKGHTTMGVSFDEVKKMIDQLKPEIAVRRLVDGPSSTDDISAMEQRLTRARYRAETSWPKRLMNAALRRPR